MVIQRLFSYFFIIIFIHFSYFWFLQFSFSGFTSCRLGGDHKFSSTSIRQRSTAVRRALSLRSQWRNPLAAVTLNYVAVQQPPRQWHRSSNGRRTVCRIAVERESNGGRIAAESYLETALLHCAIASGTVYCNRSCLCVCVCGGRAGGRAGGVR